MDKSLTLLLMYGYQYGEQSTKTLWASSFHNHFMQWIVSRKTFHLNNSTLTFNIDENAAPDQT